MTSSVGGARVRARSLLLLLAMLPMLTYFGHWPEVRINVPVAGGYWSLPFASGHGGEGHSHGAGEDAHAQHCHTDMGSCLNTTSGAIAFAALMAAAVALIGRAGAFVACVAWTRGMAAGRSDAPVPPPPRARTPGLQFALT